MAREHYPAQSIVISCMSHRNSPCETGGQSLECSVSRGRMDAVWANDKRKSGVLKHATRRPAFCSARPSCCALPHAGRSSSEPFCSGESLLSFLRASSLPASLRGGIVADLYTKRVTWSSQGANMETTAARLSCYLWGPLPWRQRGHCLSLLPRRGLPVSWLARWCYGVGPFDALVTGGAG